jgi:hypothetical protein
MQNHRQFVRSHNRHERILLGRSNAGWTLEQHEALLLEIAHPQIPIYAIIWNCRAKICRQIWERVEGVVVCLQSSS